LHRSCGAEPGPRPGTEGGSARPRGRKAGQAGACGPLRRAWPAGRAERDFEPGTECWSSQRSTHAGRSVPDITGILGRRAGRAWRATPSVLVSNALGSSWPAPRASVMIRNAVLAVAGRSAGMDLGPSFLVAAAYAIAVRSKDTQGVA